MELTFLGFNDKLSQYVPDADIRQKVASAVCAQFIADTLPIQNIAQDLIENHFKMTLGGLVSEKLSELNEKINIDVKYANDLIRSLWMCRVFAAFPANPERRKYAQDRGYFDTLMGAGIYVDNETSCFLNENKRAIWYLLCALNDICGEHDTNSQTETTDTTEDASAEII